MRRRFMSPLRSEVEIFRHRRPLRGSARHNDAALVSDSQSPPSLTVSKGAPEPLPAVSVNST
eukprot:3277167-Prymnesium_polylepis.1